MAETKYGKYICAELKKEVREKQEQLPRNERRMEHVIWMDNEVIPNSLYSEIVWFWPGHLGPPEEMRKKPGVPAHAHEFDEVLAYLGTDLENPYDLGGEIELWLEDEKFIMTKSFLVFIPAGMMHCPLKHITIDRPILHFTIGPGNMYTRYDPPPREKRSREELEKHIVTKLKENIVDAPWSPPSHPIGKNGRKSGRLFFLDNEVVDGAFYVEAVWANPDLGVPDPLPRTNRPPVQAHSHDYDEALVFIGTNHDDLNDLGAEIEFWIEDEKHIIDKSCMVFIPKGTQHCPMTFRRLDIPIFHFTSGPGKMYF